MYHQVQQIQGGRSRRGEKPRRHAGSATGSKTAAAAPADLRPVAGDRGSVETSRREGKVQFRKLTTASKMEMDPICHDSASREENTFAFEFRRGSSKKASGIPIKKLIHDEVSKEMEIRRPSPSLIARLMGLETLPLPPQLGHKQLKQMDNCCQKTSAVGFHENCVSSNAHSHQMSTAEHQEFRDVFEVMDTPKVKTHKPVQKTMVSSKRNETDMDYIRQKFVDAKRLSTDESLQHSKEFSDALDILDSNKDLFLEFLQEPNSLFNKHLEDLRFAWSTRQASHITVLKSSKGTRYESNEVCSRSERNFNRCSFVQKDVKSSHRKPATSLRSRSLKEYRGSLPRNLSGRSEACTQPTRIVVLKPSLEKTENVRGAVSLTHENIHSSCRSHGEFPMPGNQELYEEGRERQKLSNVMEVMGHRVKDSREIARAITKQMKHSVNSGNKKLFTSDVDICFESEGSCILSGTAELVNTEAFSQSSECVDGWNNKFSPSSLHSTESSVSREARKRLSERWKMSHRFREVGPDGRGSSTLADMLAVSDQDTSKANLGSSTVQSVSDEILAEDEVLGAWDGPWGISSRDGWKEGSSRNLPRSKSLPASSNVYENSRLKNRKRVGGSKKSYILKDVLDMGPHDFSDGIFSRQGRSPTRSTKCRNNKPQLTDCVVENMIPEREIHVNSEELRHHIQAQEPTEQRPTDPVLSDDSSTDRNYVVGSFVGPDCKDASVCTFQEDFVQQHSASTVLAMDEELSGHKLDDVVIEETSIDHPQVDILPSQRDPEESSSSLGSKECEQPSPVSVLEPPSAEENSSSGCFERLSADLQELRMQLQLLKLESSDTYVEESECLILSDEDPGGDCHSSLHAGDTLQAFREEEDRDFSYLLDVLIASGVHGADREKLFDACSPSEYHLASDVFDKVEKKYRMLVSWGSSDRRLLFDLINSILVDMVSRCMDPQPWVKSKRCPQMWDHEGLVEGVWQTVFRQRKESGFRQEEKFLEPRWLDLEDDVDMIGREVESMLKDDLLEELVAELIIC